MWQAIVSDLVTRVQRDLRVALADMPTDLLNAPVEPGANTIGWLAWHLTRSFDRNVSELRDAPQVWISEGWYARFDRSPDPGETGFGHTSAQALAFRSPRVEIVLAYNDAVVDMIDGYLRTASDADLTRDSTSPTLGRTWTVHQRLVGVIVEGLEHVGQVSYLRGLYDRRAAGSGGAVTG